MSNIFRFVTEAVLNQRVLLQMIDNALITKDKVYKKSLKEYKKRYENYKEKVNQLNKIKEEEAKLAELIEFSQLRNRQNKRYRSSTGRR